MHFAAFTDEIAPFLTMEVMERGVTLAAEGADIVQLGVGEPDGEAPPEAVAAAIAALQNGETHYTSSLGLQALRCAIADDCRQRRGVEVSPERVVVTSGTSPALNMVLRMLLSPGDEIILPTPHYPCYPNMVLACGARPVFVPTAPEDGFVIDVAAVRAAVTPRTRGIVVASPSNPTGAVQPREVMEGLSQLGIPVLSDEIYDGLVFDGAQVVSPLGMGDACFVFDGFSKRYAMTGFRLGYVIAPEAAVRPLQKMQQNFHISASHFVQRAGLAALQHGAGYVEATRRAYGERRSLMLRGLRELGLGVSRDPQGAFYVLADARDLDPDSLRLCFDLLDRAHVAIAPGRDFGEAAEGFLRFSYATASDRIEEGLRRLAPVIAELRSRPRSPR